MTFRLLFHLHRRKSVLTLTSIYSKLLLNQYLIYGFKHASDLCSGENKRTNKRNSSGKTNDGLCKDKYETEKVFSKILQKSNSKGVVMRVCPIYTKSFVDNLHSKIYDPKDQYCFIYGTGEYGFSFCCLYNIVDFVLGILNVSTGITYHGIYNLCDTKSITAKEIVEFERQFHKLGAVIQKTYGADAIKSAISFGSKAAKVDYRYNDLSIITSNISYDNTKAQRISTFRWKLSNTR
jgi:UDP-glucose 4-epimerase